MPLLGARLLTVFGRYEKVGEVHHLVAEYIRDDTPLLRESWNEEPGLQMMQCIALELHIALRFPRADDAYQSSRRILVFSRSTRPILESAFQLRRASAANRRGNVLWTESGVTYATRHKE